MLDPPACIPTAAGGWWRCGWRRMLRWRRGHADRQWEHPRPPFRSGRLSLGAGRQQGNCVRRQVSRSRTDHGLFASWRDSDRPRPKPLPHPFPAPVRGSPAFVAVAHRRRRAWLSVAPMWPASRPAVRSPMAMGSSWLWGWASVASAVSPPLPRLPRQGASINGAAPVGSVVAALAMVAAVKAPAVAVQVGVWAVSAAEAVEATLGGIPTRRRVPSTASCRRH